MQNIFNLDNRFFSFMSKVADVMILNLLFIITCIPIVTIGTSVAALYSVSLKLDEGKEPYIVRGYFHSWKENFRQGTILWLLVVAVCMLLVVNLMLKTSGMVYIVMRTGMVIALACVGVILLYLFPLLAKFQNTITHTVTNAFLMSTRHILTTCMLFGTNVFFVFITLANPSLVAQFSILWFLFGFAVIARIQSHFLNKVFRCYISA